MTRKIVVLITVIIFCLALVGCASTRNNSDSGQKTSSEQETVVAKPLVISLGENNPEARKVAVINDTGKTITYFSIDEYHPYTLETQIQLALIAQEYLYGGADGEIGPFTLEAIERYREDNDLPDADGIDEALIVSLLGTGYTQNLLPAGETFPAGSTRNLFYETSADNAGTQSDPVAAFMNRNDVACDHVITLYFAGEDGSVVLHAFPADHADEIRIRMDGDIPYVVYDSEEIEIPVTTLQIEKAIWNVVHAEPEEETEEPEA